MGDRSVVVTGSSGMIGTALCKHFLSIGTNVVGVDRHPNQWSSKIDRRTIRCDLTTLDDFSKLPEDPDLIVHLAANARVNDSVHEVGLAHENYRTTAMALEYAKETNSKLLFASSREVYGTSEDEKCGTDPLSLQECQSPYAASKIAGEALLHSYRNSYDVEAGVLRFSNVYGRYDQSNRVIPLFISLASRDADLTIFGSNKRLDFTYIEDCIDGIIQSIDNFKRISGQILNIASGTSNTLEYVAQTIADRLDSNSRIIHESSRAGEIHQFDANIERAKELVGFSPQYSLDDGLHRTIEWYLDRPSVRDAVLEGGKPVPRLRSNV